MQNHAADSGEFDAAAMAVDRANPRHAGRHLPPPVRLVPLALVLLLSWAAVILLFAVQLRFGNRLDWGTAFARSLFDRGPWAILSPLILLLVWYLHRQGFAPWRAALCHVAGIFVALLAAEGLVQGVFLKLMFSPPAASAPLERVAPPGLPPGMPPPKMGARPPRDMPGPVMPPPDRGGPPPDFSPDTPPWAVFTSIALRKAYNGIPIYLVIAALAHAFFFWRNLRERERRVSQLEERLTVARADLLRLQLEPHFLFNTLNSIGTLVYRDPKLADDLIVRLSTLLRRLLDLRDERTIPLATEMETLRAYVAIEQARFGERLNYAESVDPAALDFQVPVLLLQPLAENAVRHGIEPLGRPGTLFVAVSVRGGELEVLIEDDGAGLNAGDGKKRGFGLGLSSASVRLKAMYGAKARIEAGPRAGGGTRIQIRLPHDPLPAVAAFTQTSERD